MAKNIHIVPHGSKWQVKPAGSAPVSTHNTQRTAINYGKPLAQRNQSELVIHRPNGVIRDKDSFGKDPHPPTDRKH